MRNYYIPILIVIALLFVATYYYQMNQQFNESDAIALLKSAYPEYAKYPNDSLPPQSIRTEKDADGWYVAFVQEGSGRPIIEAKCYFVSSGKEIRYIGNFKPTVNENAEKFSIKTCSL